MATQLYFRWPNRRSLAQALLWSFAFVNIIGVIIIWRTGSAYYIEHPGEGNIWLALGRLTGLLGQLGLLMELILISRLPLVEVPYGFDRLNRVHRWTGFILGVMMVLHPILLTYAGAISSGQGWLWQFTDFLTNRKHVLESYFGLVALAGVIILSIGIVRKRFRYETWYLVHLLTYVGIGLTFLHQLHVGDLKTLSVLRYWYTLNIGVFSIVLIFRFARPIGLFLRHDFHVEHISMETKDIWSIYVSGRHMETFFFQPGQYANLRFITRQHWWQSHPFSFSAAQNNSTLRFSIKASGDFTKSIRDIRFGTSVLIDGPLGQFVTSRVKHKKLLTIAGGIGVTPILAILEKLKDEQQNAVLLYACRTSADIAMRTEIEALEKQGSLRVHYILGAPEPGFESGYIDREKIVRLVPDFFEREVFLCGPPPMMKAVVGQLNGLGFPEERIHYEKFSF